MRPPTGNRITQGQHLSSKAVDYSYSPDHFVYAPEDGTIDSYQQRGSGTNDAGNCLRMNGEHGLHQFAHLAECYVSPGQWVVKGQRLAKMGYTGYTIPSGPNGAHLHYWVQTPNGYVYPPNLTTEPFGGSQGGDMPIPDADNYYSRYGQKLARQLIGRELTREEFKKTLVGKTDLEVVETLADGPEADRAQMWQDTGKRAVEEDWEGKLATKPKEVRVEVPVEKTVEKEVIKEVPGKTVVFPITDYPAGDLFRALLQRAISWINKKG